VSDIPRVVITGMGALSPYGRGVPELWSGLASGRSGIGTVTRFDASDYPTRIAGEVPDLDASDLIDRKELRRLDLYEIFAIVATDEAISDAAFAPDNGYDPERTGAIIGSGIGGITTWEDQHTRLLKGGVGRVSPFFIPMMISDMAAGLVSMRWDLRGPNYATVSACATSAHAVADAYRIIKRGEADVMVVGGAEATVTPLSFAGFCQNRAMSTSNDDPEAASRPFDSGRDGFVMGEGAGIIVLESEQHALDRGAKVRAVLSGIGMTADAHHITAPHPEGRGAQRAMEIAIADAGIAPEEIDYVNSHGTATPLGDIAETKAIRGALGAHADKVAVNATKSLIGHLLGASGAVELIVAIRSMEEGYLHPTLNLTDPDPECDLDYVPLEGRAANPRTAISNSFGFGGHNVSLIVQLPD
jgi:3-oxoacyl-[acyl-carrier-protein] synthase II